MDIHQHCDTTDFILVGLKKFFLHDYLGAIAEYTLAIEKEDGQDALAYLSRGIANLELGQKIEAVADFNRAMDLGIRLPPDLMKAYSDQQDQMRSMQG